MVALNRLPRGLIEVSNYCAKNCYYCGIRRDNAAISRYHLTEEEVLECCREALRRNYPAIALQAGEIESESNTTFYERILTSLDSLTQSNNSQSINRLIEKSINPHPSLEVTLSLGEQTENVYRRWKIAGGDRVMRYLLRIETSNRELYAKLHPADHSFDRRVECLRTLKRLGYVTGSGVMIGLPTQTLDDLKRDLDWFEEMDLDMIGMGPYIPAPNTPLVGTAFHRRPPDSSPLLDLSLWMISEVRRRMPHVNIVAATALEALDPNGREKGFQAGANVYMPNLTPTKYRLNYNLYPGKTECVQ